MRSIIIYPDNGYQETIIKDFLGQIKAHYYYSTPEDDTSYLSTTAMRERLETARRQEKNGEGITISLDYILEISAKL